MNSYKSIKSVKKFTLLALGIVAVAGIITGCGSTSSDSKKAPAEKVLHVGTNATFVPFEFKNDKTQDYDGFDIDLVKAIAKKMNAKIEWKNVSFDALIPSLTSKDIDIAASGMTITKARSEKVLFSSPYYESGLAFLTKADSDIQSNGTGLTGKTISVQLGTTGADLAHKLNLNPIKEYDHSNEAILEIKIGGADATILDLPVAQYYVTTHPEDNYKVVPYVSEKKEYFGLAMNKENTALKAEVDKAIADLKASGEFNTLYKKWFHQDAPNMPAQATF